VLPFLPAATLVAPGPRAAGLIPLLLAAACTGPPEPEPHPERPEERPRAEREAPPPQPPTGSSAGAAASSVRAPLIALAAAPNPLVRTTRISFILGAPSDVRLHIHDHRGALVMGLVRTDVPPGYHSLTWNATDRRGSRVRPGVYFYRFVAGHSVRTGRLVVVP
jgi:hypothetical protein